MREGRVGQRRERRNGVLSQAEHPQRGEGGGRGDTVDAVVGAVQLLARARASIYAKEEGTAWQRIRQRARSAGCLGGSTRCCAKTEMPRHGIIPPEYNAPNSRHRKMTDPQSTAARAGSRATLTSTVAGSV